MPGLVMHFCHSDEHMCTAWSGRIEGLEVSQAGDLQAHIVTLLRRMCQRNEPARRP